ncbi:squalene cyclase [Ruania suaedae]|uniref:squalene cyclase n=1 Tax=Ruania suaedae TaxID=2897774 RepID=UPI001E5F2D9A|nr:squalene cyclase [Ruania suaedae]UFU04047.1 squalene cyclase [Ruania suaedae]
MATTALHAWLLDSDPALRWQVERDLVHEPEHVWRATRARVQTEGFGARLLALQDPEGTWAGGAHFPGDFSKEEFARSGQPWTATTWSLNALREWGVPAQTLEGTAELLDRHARWEYDDLPFWSGEVDACINGFTLANGVWLGADVAGIADWFVTHRLADGGWNCEWVEGSTRSSFHSTLNALKGLLAWEMATGGSPQTRAARRAGEEYLLERGLFRRLSTGEQVGEWSTVFSYPMRWVCSVLNAADYFRTAALTDGGAPDERLRDAIAVIRAQEQHDGTWIQAHRHPGRVWFHVDVPPGEPSKWLTFHARRVLQWWDGAGR